jgi:hypothetical protein
LSLQPNINIYTAALGKSHGEEKRTLIDQLYEKKGICSVSVRSITFHGFGFIHSFNRFIRLQQRIFIEGLYPMNTLRPLVFSHVRFGPLPVSATVVIAFALNGASPARNHMQSVAVSSAHPIIAPVLSDRSLSDETAPSSRCPGSGCSVMHSGTMVMPLKQVF